MEAPCTEADWDSIAKQFRKLDADGSGELTREDLAPLMKAQERRSVGGTPAEPV